MRTVFNAGDSLTAVLSGAKSSLDAIVHANYSDGNTNRAISAAVKTNGTTPVTVLGAGAAGPKLLMDSLTIYNADNAAITITLAHVIAATSFTLTTLTLQSGDTGTVAADGSIRIVDANGQVKQNGGNALVVPVGIPVDGWKEADGVTGCPATAATTNFGLIQGTDGTNFPHLETINGKNTTTAVVCRRVVSLPPNYVNGSALKLRINAGMKTTVATVSALLAVTVYSNSGNQLGSANICTTSAPSVNSLTPANFDFVITPTGLVAGQDLNIVITLTIVDGQNSVAVIGVINHVELHASLNF